MKKDFDSWNIQKKKTDRAEKRALFKEREVWWCRLGTNIGDEQNGKGLLFARPVLVFKKFNHNVFLGIPFSTQLKDKKYYCKIKFKDIEQSAILSQIRLIDAKRFVNKMGNLPEPEMAIIARELKELIF